MAHTRAGRAGHIGRPVPEGSTGFGRGMDTGEATVARASSRRRLAAATLTLVAAAVMFVAAAPGAHALEPGSAQPTYPTLDLGMSGLNVAALEHLAYSGWLMLNEVAVFDDYEQLWTRAVQTWNGQPATGVTGPQVWPLFAPTRPGGPQAQVEAVQTLLGKVGFDAPVTGQYGLLDAVMVWWFQAIVGLPQTGMVDETTWKYLLWHYQELPYGAAALPGVCPTDPYNNWVDAAVWSYMERAGQALDTASLPALGITDASSIHGGPLSGHGSHQVGLDIDIRPVSQGTTGCPQPLNIVAAHRSASYEYSNVCLDEVDKNPAYDRDRTRTQIESLVNASRSPSFGGHHVKVVYFNDCLITDGMSVENAGLMNRSTNHYDHWHIRFCEPAPARGANGRSECS